MASDTTSGSWWLRPDWKERTAHLAIFALATAVIYAIVALAWGHLRFAVLLALLVSVFLKIGLLIRLSAEVIKEANSCGGCFGAAVAMPAALLVLFIFDHQTIPLWADQLGKPTTAQVTALFVRPKTARIVKFEFTNGDDVFSVEQQVTWQIFESLNRGDKIRIKYLSFLPQIAAVENDGGHLKLPISLSIAIAATTPWVFYSSEIVEWWKIRRKKRD